MNFSDYKDIFDFYRKTQMTREQAFNFLLNELKKGNEREDNGKHSKQ